MKKIKGWHYGVAGGALWGYIMGKIVPGEWYDVTSAVYTVLGIVAIFCIVRAFQGGVTVTISKGGVGDEDPVSVWTSTVEPYGETLIRITVAKSGHQNGPSRSSPEVSPVKD